MSSEPSENGGIELSASRQVSDTTTDVLGAAPHDGDLSIPREPRWGFWATVGFSLVVLVTFVGLQTIVAIGFVLAHVADNGRLPNHADAEALASNGLLLSLSALFSMPPCLALAALFAKLKRGATISGYLGLRGAPLGVAFTWLGITLLYVAAADGLTYALGRPIVPAVIATAYSTAGFLPLLWIALLLMAPVFEEMFFRGFMLEGFRHTRLGTVGAVLVTSLVWAVIHIQYDAFQIGVIFVGGLLLGAAKIGSGSVWLSMAMHCLQNIIATIETAVFVHLQGNAG